jgi:hypothetical protein
MSASPPWPLSPCDAHRRDARRRHARDSSRAEPAATHRTHQSLITQYCAAPHSPPWRHRRAESISWALTGVRSAAHASLPSCCCSGATECVGRGGGRERVSRVLPCRLGALVLADSRSRRACGVCVASRARRSVINCSCRHDGRCGSLGVDALPVRSLRPVWRRCRLPAVTQRCAYCRTRAHTRELTPPDARPARPAGAATQCLFCRTL